MLPAFVAAALNKSIAPKKRKPCLRAFTLLAMSRETSRHLAATQI
jgi:hypothetical protein